MKTNIGINKTNRQKVSIEFSKLLADEFLLYTKTRKAHWNLEGADFFEKYKFFENQYEQLDKIMDDVAERIRSLGHFAPATLKEFLQLTHLSEMNHRKNNSQSFIKELLSDHENIIMFLRGKINPFADKYKDAGTSDFITGLVANS